MELALRRLWSVPAGDLPPRGFHPEEASSVIGGALADSVRPDGVAGQAYDICVAHLQPADIFGRPVIGHGDANLANYLWDGVSIRLVDFEDAGVSSVEYELGFLVEHPAGTLDEQARHILSLA